MHIKANSFVISILKVHFVIHNFIPNCIFSKKLRFFISTILQYKLLGGYHTVDIQNICCKFIWQNNHQIIELLCWNNVVAYATVQYSKLNIAYITHKCHIRINWKFGNKLNLCISTELCHKNSTLGSQNKPLSLKVCAP